MNNSLHPSAPASCVSPGTSKRIRNRFSSVLRAPGFFATPPVRTAGGTIPIRSAMAAIRVSPHFYNTPEEIDRFFAILREERTRA